MISGSISGSSPCGGGRGQAGGRGGLSCGPPPCSRRHAWPRLQPVAQQKGYAANHAVGRARVTVQADRSNRVAALPHEAAAQRWASPTWPTPRVPWPKPESAKHTQPGPRGPGPPTCTLGARLDSNPGLPPNPLTPRHTCTLTTMSYRLPSLLTASSHRSVPADVV